MNQRVECPLCGISIKIEDNLGMGQIIECSACRAQLEVVWLDPLELDVLDEIDDDEEDAYEGYDYEYEPDYDQEPDYDYGDPYYDDDF
jgi:alpha-aminoadipate carrier protein LysW